MASRLERELKRREAKRLADLNRYDRSFFKTVLQISLIALAIIAGITIWFVAAERQAEAEAWAAVLRSHRITSAAIEPARALSFNGPDEIDWAPEAPEPEIKEEAVWESIGTFTLTFYCPCRKCSGKWGHRTSTGATCEEGITVAVDPKVIPYGTRLLIDGHEYIAQDTGVKGRRIDIFMESHKACLDNGVQKTEVYIKR